MFLPSVSAQPSAPYKEPPSSRLWLIALAVSVFIGIFAGAVVFRNRTPEDYLNDLLVVPPRVIEDEQEEGSQGSLEGVGSAPELRPDADGDGLSDEEEARLGTNARSHDTDGDGISDREEAMILKTDPKTPNPSPFVHPLDRERQQGATTPPAVNP